MTEAPFWQSRPVLEHVLAVARARAVGPWALLGAVLARAIATIPPDIALPGIVGGRMSLNLFVALVGPSGGGKGAAEAVAIDAFRFATSIETVPLGSGEGIARTFRPVGTKPEEPNATSAAIFTAPEIDTLMAISSRQGSSLSAELRKMYSGEQLGFGNAGKETRVIVPTGSYRACLLIGVQPLRSHTLLNASDGGLPQRFTWLPTSDPDAPDARLEDPGLWTVSRPSWLRPAGVTFELNVPEAAVNAIRAHRRAVLREDRGVDPLDGHALLTRVKVAVGLMALDGRAVISTADWGLAGFVMDVSNYTRERCQRTLAEQSRKVNTARALATADREEIISERKLQRCKDGIVRATSRLPDGSLIPHNQLRRSLKSDVRDYFDAATGELIDEGRIYAERTPKGIGYASPRVERMSTTSDLRKSGVDARSTVDHVNNRNRRRTRGKNRSLQRAPGEASA
jgi:hypothetical protein